MHVSRRAVLAAAALWLLPWLALCGYLLWIRTPAPPPPPASPGAASPSGEDLQRCRPGPWGELQYARILIEPPDDFITADYLQAQPLAWVFAGMDLSAVQRLWTDVGLSERERNALSAAEVTRAVDGGVIVHPPASLVAALTSAARTKLYSVLAALPGNPRQNEPFRFRADAIDDWFVNSDLTPATVGWVRRFIYTRGNSALFSDLDLVLPHVPALPERIRLVATLARKSTLLVTLRISPTSDIDSLVQYWGGGPRAKDIAPLLQSLAGRPRGLTLDVAHLLPRFARARLYTYPGPADQPDDASRDCHWTSLNFFSDPPNAAFGDAAVVQATLEQSYSVVTGSNRFGDVLAFMRPNGEVVHTCVYVADDIVFTKNGASYAMPWMLMKLEDVIAFYPSATTLAVVTYRPRR